MNEISEHESVVADLRPTPTTSYDEEEKLTAFINWFEEQGGICNVNVRNEWGSRGVYLKQDVTDKTLPLIQVPNKLILSLDRINSLQFNATTNYSQIYVQHQDLFFSRENKNEGQDLQVVFFLLSERSKGEDSFWHHFLQTLPQEYLNFSTHPDLSEIHAWIENDEDKLLNMIEAKRR